MRMSNSRHTSHISRTPSYRPLRELLQSIGAFLPPLTRWALVSAARSAGYEHAFPDSAHAAHSPHFPPHRTLRMFCCEKKF
jgi:hypothetical protein